MTVYVESTQSSVDFKDKALCSLHIRHNIDLENYTYNTDTCSRRATRERETTTLHRNRMRDEHTIKVFWHNAPLKDTQTDCVDDCFPSD